MAALISYDFDIKELGDHMKSDLPSYAKPLFIRLVSERDLQKNISRKCSILKKK